MNEAGVVTESDHHETPSVATVELGDVTFDPVGVSDFRLSVEGTSNVGKSNSLAVLLEDLAAVNLPTLIIERLGALTSVRSVDEDLIVVGAREEDGIDLAVSLEQLDRVGEWVLDHGQKLLVDISTYADYHEERSRIHLAAATALQSLNDRAHAKYRSGNRVKSLLVVDEAHYLAPKQGAPEPRPDDYVNRCRGQLIKASTEGGNKGISIVTAYQRRAFLHNGVIQLCEDYVAHKPGAEDVERTADALRCDPGTLASLGTGQIVARGATLTAGELVGPTTVRKRQSPDPREETFDLPEFSGETEGFLERVAQDVEAERERRQQRQDELEALQTENEQLQETVDRLERELEDSERLAAAVETLQRSNGHVLADGEEQTGGRDERVSSVQAERDRATAHAEVLASKHDELTARNRQLERALGEVSATLRACREKSAAVADSIDRLTTVVDDHQSVANTPADGRTENARVPQRVGVNDYLSRRRDIAIATQLADYEELLALDIVRTEVEDAKGAVSERYVSGVLAAVTVEQGWVPYDEIADRLAVSTTTDISRAATELERRQIVRKDRRADGVYVDLDVDGIQELRIEDRARQQTETVMEQV